MTLVEACGVDVAPVPYRGHRPAGGNFTSPEKAPSKVCLLAVYAYPNSSAISAPTALL